MHPDNARERNVTVENPLQSRDGVTLANRGRAISALPR
jgi:hypothetical protein